MLIEEIINLLEKVSTPLELFGLCSKEEIRKKYFKYAKIIHPDMLSYEQKLKAGNAFSKLYELYEQAKKEIDDNVYGETDLIKIYNKKASLFEIEINNKIYKFYEHVFQGEVANVYRGILEDQIVYLKISILEEDNQLLQKEYKNLSGLSHYSLPIMECELTINNHQAFIMKEVKGEEVNSILKYFPNGIPASHVMWMLERLFSVIGYLHSNYIVHGNLKPENIIIDTELHNVSLVGFSLAIEKANEVDAKYNIINEIYTPKEVSKNKIVMPNVDIYAIGKIAILLLGGDPKNNGMPININPEIRNFIRSLVEKTNQNNNNDAWDLWNQTIKLRNEIYGKSRFLKLEKKL